ncbi:PadR family transcriptional regulator [Ornithinimicrobium sp. Y1847]|uniref:PadR family transcriptional regulator n=1 Tax=unclassified Ornithinimicrobium TaxID=2615080 RepID=UPI003B677853
MATHDPQMIKGVLRLLLLHVLADEDGYGYAVVSRLREAGFEELAEGTVYPALTRLEGAGLLTSYLQASSSGPARKYYTLSDAGRAELARSKASWDQLRTAVQVVLQNTDTTKGT